MKRLFSLFLIFSLIGGMGTSAMSAQAATAKLNKKKLTLMTGDTYTLKVKKASGKVKWKSSKKSVASVSSKGKVKAKRSGSATITARVSGKKLTCRIKVKSAAKGTRANPKSAYALNTFTFYQEEKKSGKFSIKLLRFESGAAAAAMASCLSSIAIPPAWADTPFNVI